MSIGPRANQGRLRVGLAVVGLALLVAAQTVALHAAFTSRVPGAADFYARWQPTRAWLLTGQNPYSAEATRANQLGTFGRLALPHEDQLQFAYPLLAAFLVLPAALIPDYAWASAFWLALLQLSLAALVVVSATWSHWRPRPWLLGATLVFGLLWYHAARTLLLGQVAGILAALLAGALVAIQRRQDRVAGVLLALTAAKPQIAVLIIPAVWIWAASARRWTLLGWSAGALALLLGVSFVLLPSWLGDWLGQIPIYAGTTVSAPPVEIAARALWPSQAVPVQVVLSGVFVAVLLMVWRRAMGRTGEAFDHAAGLTLVTTCLVAPRIATTDYVIMTPVLFTLFGSLALRVGRWGSGPVLALQAALLAGLWGLFLGTVQGNQEQAVMYLPLPIGLWIYLMIGESAHDKTH